MLFSVIDIETTGGSPQQSRITEIAIIVTDGKQIVDQYETLVNPEQKIPPFITKLTGIKNEMVAHAPTFHQISSTVSKLTKDSVFVAHNVAFDYGMVRNEFRDLGMDFHRNILCTVKSSRRLMPGLPSYSLGDICKQLSIEIKERHRAMGDAEGTLHLFNKMLGEHNEQLLQLIEDGSPRFTGNPKADEWLKNIPESTGVYSFHDKNNDVIMVGSGTNIRKKVFAHLTHKSSRSSFELRNSISDVTYEVTGSELLSMMVEMSEIKRIQPIFNSKPKPQKSKTRHSSGAFYLIDKGPDRYTRSLMLVTQQQVSWGYFPSTYAIEKPEDFQMFLKYSAWGKEYQQLALQYLSKGRVEKVIKIKT
ncbi:MAG: exonuclease domain-containing protein [Bacteroidota bacterium]